MTVIDFEKAAAARRSTQEEIDRWVAHIERGMLAVTAPMVMVPKPPGFRRRVYLTLCNIMWAMLRRP